MNHYDKFIDLIELFDYLNGESRAYLIEQCLSPSDVINGEYFTYSQDKKTGLITKALNFSEQQKSNFEKTFIQTYLIEVTIYDLAKANRAIENTLVQRK